MGVPDGDATRGKALFVQRCAQCHSIDGTGKHKTGPNLYGVIGRKAGQAAGYGYSQANKTIGITWTKDNLSEFLEDSKKFMPGTKMVTKLKKAQERADIIAYMEKEK